MGEMLFLGRWQMKSDACIKYAIRCSQSCGPDPTCPLEDIFVDHSDCVKLMTERSSQSVKTSGASSDKNQEKWSPSLWTVEVENKRREDSTTKLEFLEDCESACHTLKLCSFQEFIYKVAEDALEARNWPSNYNKSIESRKIKIEARDDQPYASLFDLIIHSLASLLLTSNLNGDPKAAVVPVVSFKEEHWSDDEPERMQEDPEPQNENPDSNTDEQRPIKTRPKRSVTMKRKSAHYDSPRELSPLELSPRSNTSKCGKTNRAKRKRTTTNRSSASHRVTNPKAEQNQTNDQKNSDLDDFKTPQICANCRSEFNGNLDLCPKCEPAIPVKSKKQASSGAVCGACDKEFFFVARLLNHCKKAHPDLPEVWPQEPVKLGPLSTLHERQMVISDKKKVFECAVPLCNLRFERFLSLIKHERSGHPKAHVCILCGILCKSNEDLINHSTQVHGKKATYICRICGFFNRTQRYLITHMQQEHKKGVIVYQCDECTFTTETYSTFRNHKRNAHRDAASKYVCEECGNHFSTSQSLSSHRKLHNPEFKKIQCDFCPQKFGHPSHLLIHMTVHTGEKPFLCETCGAAFGSQSACGRHKRVLHAKEKDMVFTCADCGKRYPARAKKDFENHCKVHTGVRDHVCGLCGSSYFTSKGLRKHERIAHSISANRAKPFKIQESNSRKKSEGPTPNAVVAVNSGQDYSLSESLLRSTDHLLPVARTAPRSSLLAGGLPLITEGRIDPLDGGSKTSNIIGHSGLGRSSQEQQTVRETGGRFVPPALPFQASSSSGMRATTTASLVARAASVSDCSIFPGGGDSGTGGREPGEKPADPSQSIPAYYRPFNARADAIVQAAKSAIGMPHNLPKEETSNSSLSLGQISNLTAHHAVVNRESARIYTGQDSCLDSQNLTEGDRLQLLNSFQNNK